MDILNNTKLKKLSVIVKNRYVIHFGISKYYHKDSLITVWKV